MSSTNKTTNYNLSQFVGSDKPAWLGDYNTDMVKIDTAIKGASDDASEGKTQSTTNKNAIGTLANLTTTVKDNLVSAINEVKTTAENAGTSAVGTARLTNGAVTTEKIEDGAVTNNKVSWGGVYLGKMLRKTFNFEANQWSGNTFTISPAQLSGIGVSANEPVKVNVVYRFNNDTYKSTIEAKISGSVFASAGFVNEQSSVGVAISGSAEVIATPDANGISIALESNDYTKSACIGEITIAKLNGVTQL